MELGEALDAARGYVTRVAKPFQKIEEVLAAAQDAAALVLEANARLASLAAEEQAAQERLEQLWRDAETAANGLADFETFARDATAVLRAQVGEAQTRYDTVAAEMTELAAAKRAQLDADYDARLTILQAEIDALELRKAALTKAVDALRASVAIIEATA